MLLSLGAAAQDNNIQVKSFRMLVGDMTTTSAEGKRIDQNNEVCALIKIVTTEKDFAFEGGALGIVGSQQRKGEVWVWVPRGLRKITILHDQLGVLRDYRFPEEIIADRTYEMVLTTAKVETIIKEEVRMQYLGFQITPPNATLWVNEEIWELEPDGTTTQFLNFGTYDWRVQAPNYHPDAGRVTLNNANETELVTVNMHPNFGWVEVAGDGALKDASVYVDDNFVGKAPCKSEALKSGQHTLRVVKKMYATFSQTVMVTDNETTRLAPTLIADFAEVTLKVDADADIYVNDERKGTRSWTGPLANGTYKIECKQAGHETSQTTKEITAAMAGQTLTLPAPRPIYGSLNVESSPNFCKLYLDGKDMGNTPKFISEILIGQHQIRLTKEGYADHVETVMIAKDEHKTLKANLSKADNEPSYQPMIEDPILSEVVGKEVKTPTPFDPNVRRGKLSNGMAYYICHNETPAGCVDFCLAQKVGSILEEENQCGFSYFLEHMALNGTANFPGKRLFEYLHSRGIYYGKDIIFETGFDETVYKITNVPTRFPRLVDSCLLILHDWSGFLSLDDATINKERSVVLEKIRSQEDVNQRLMKTILPGIYPHSRYARRFPSGSPEVVANFTCQALRDYYHKWYRPDLQCLIIVGDIDVNAVETRIKNVFADIKAPVKPAPRLRYKVNDNETPIVVIASDPEATNYSITLSYKHDIVPDKEKEDIFYWLKGYLDDMIATMYNNRLRELAQKANPPFIFDNGYYGTFFISDTKDAWTSMAYAKDKDGIDEAMNTIVAENKRMQQYGFTASEFERAKADLMKRIEIQYDKRDKLETDRFFRPILSHFFTNEPLMGIENEYMLLSQILPTVPVEAINAYVKEIIREDNIVITLTGPQNSGETQTSKQKILRILSSR